LLSDIYQIIRSILMRKG